MQWLSELEVSRPSQLNVDGCHFSHKDQVGTETGCLLLVDKTSLSRTTVCRLLPPILEQQWIEMVVSKTKSWCGTWLFLYHPGQPHAHACDPD